MIDDRTYMPLWSGQRARMDIVGMVKRGRGPNAERFPYGWVDRIRVFVRKSNLCPVQPGDRVMVQIQDLEERCAIAVPTSNHGNFIKYYIQNNQAFEIRLTGRNNKDARNSVSDPRYEGAGISGVYTIVNRAIYQAPRLLENDYSFPMEAVIPRKFGTGKTGQYYIIAELQDPSRERKPEDDFFTAAWTKAHSVLSDKGYTWEYETPKLPEIPKMIKGVPKDLGFAFYLNRKAEPMVINRNQVRNVSHISLELALKLFMENCRPGSFRLALADREAVPSLHEAMDAIGQRYERL